MNSKIEEINHRFKIPMYYNEDKREIDPHIINDLELIQTVDPSCNPICTFYFNNNNDISRKLNEQFAQHYTTDVAFLKDNQTLLQSFKPLGVVYTDYSANYKNIVDIWNELKIDHGFKEKYYFIEWEMFDFLNRSQWFLQFISIYNLMSPIFSLLIPILILIIPFFIIKMKGLPITVTEYIQILKTIASTNAIGKLFTVNLNEIPSHQKLYILVSAMFYLFSIYQNFMVCYRFNQNMKTIHTHFNEIKIYINHTIQSMKNYLSYASSLTTHQSFNQTVQANLDTLTSIQQKISTITEYNMFNFNKLTEIGYVFKCFYELHKDSMYDDAILYSLGFNGYIDAITGLQQNIADKKMHFATFSNKTEFKDSYYAPFKNTNPVTNRIQFKKNIIITGPNASGKTTVLKSALINILITQQFGCGFYSSATLRPFHHVHCYLNIPDTSGRDSLFQAEARRCKEILDKIHAHSKENHFCAFDELYSGTNPEEAEQSAIAFMKYITKYKNVSCILTTHFIKVCKKLSTSTSVVNYRMKTQKKDDHLTYFYLLEKGISNVKGGLMVLQQMNYPQEIIQHTSISV